MHRCAISAYAIVEAERQSAEHDPVRSPKRVILDFLTRYGHNTTSFQVLEPGLEYWLDPDGCGCVAYAPVGRSWVVAGAPVAPPDRIVDVLERFQEAAARHNRRVRCFGIEKDISSDTGFSCLHIGNQATWNPQQWESIVRSKRSLREQLRRARAKYVKVRRVGTDELQRPSSAIRMRLDDMIEDWLESRAMAPMGFLLHLDPYSFAAERRFFVAEQEGRVVGCISAVPIYARKGWFFEDVLREPNAPNGTVELLFDFAMRALAAEGCTHVSYGLAPLADTQHRWLRAIRDHTRWLYDFEGVRRFKSKLLPSRWEPVYLAYPKNERGVRATVDILAAFARGSFLRFSVETALHRAADIIRILAILLIPWTFLLALAPTSPWFPSRSVQDAWVMADLGIFLALMALARRWRKSLAIAVGCAAFADFSLGLVQALHHNWTRDNSWVQGTVVLAALGAPLFASIFLWSARDRAERYRFARLGKLHHHHEPID